MPHLPPCPKLRLIRTASILAIILNLSVIWEVLAKDNQQLYAEGSFVETTSAVAFLCGAVILFATSSFRQGLSKFLTVVLATVNLTAFLREVDVAEYNVPSPLLELGSNSLKDIILTLVFLTYVAAWIKNYRHRMKDAWQTFQSSAGALFFLGGLLFLIASVVEQFDHKLVEELLEANAALAFLCGSLLFGLQEPGALTDARRDRNDLST